MQLQVFPSALDSNALAAHSAREELLIHQRRHTSEVAIRLLESLHFLQHHIADLETHVNTHEFPAPNQLALSRRAGIRADSVLQYLGMFLDAIGRTIPMVVLDDPREHQIDGLNKAIKAAEKQEAYEKVKQVCCELTASDSWWSVGFQRTVGLRQRITHYPDLVSFTIHSVGDGQRSATAYVHRAARLEPMNDANLTKSISKILEGMCNWLERLEVILNEIVAARALRMGAQVHDFPSAQFCVPSLEFGDAPVDCSNYLYLPICANAVGIRGRMD
jgi:hypothetical protein